MDLLSIQGLRLNAHIGVHAWEQRISQVLLVDIAIPLDVSSCKDDLSTVLDYDALCQTISTHVANHHYQLIESLANALADLIKAEYQLSEISLSVSKPHAVKSAANIKITVNR